METRSNLKYFWLVIPVLVILYFVLTHQYTSFLDGNFNFLDSILLLLFILSVFMFFFPSRKKVTWAERISLVVSIGALLYAHMGYVNSRTALDFQKQEAAKRRETKLKIDADFIFDKVHFSGFKEQILDYDVINGKAVINRVFTGLEFFVLVKVTNRSEHAVSVDSIFGRLRYYMPHNVMHFEFGTNFETDFKTKARFPSLLQPYEQRRWLIQIPVIFDEKIRSIFSGLSADSLYTAGEIIQANNKNSRNKYISITSNAREDNFGKMLGLFADMFVPADSDGTRNQYRFLISVISASGDTITKAYDGLMNPIP